MEGVLEAAAVGDLGDGETGGGEQAGAALDAEAPEITAGRGVVVGAEEADEMLRRDGGGAGGSGQGVGLGAVLVEPAAGALVGRAEVAVVAAFAGHADVFVEESEAEGLEHAAALGLAPGGEAEGGVQEGFEGARLREDVRQALEAAALRGRDGAGPQGAPSVVRGMAAREAEALGVAGVQERDGAGRDVEGRAVDPDAGFAEENDDELVLELRARAEVAAGIVPDVAACGVGPDSAGVNEGYVSALPSHSQNWAGMMKLSAEIPT